jgi:P-type E1-E2 ATPase
MSGTSSSFFFRTPIVASIVVSILELNYLTGNDLWRREIDLQNAGNVCHCRISESFRCYLGPTTRLPSQNTLRVICALVNEAKISKPKVEEIADRVAGYLVPLILGITVVVFITWTAIGIAGRHQSTTAACINAMTFAISTLIVSCPCAIGLAVPIVVLIAGGVAARHGLIFKAAQTIDIARKVDHVIFDKTGTLTQGKLSVTREEYLDDPKTVASMVLGLTSNSKHPVSTGVVAHLKGMNVDPSHVENVVSIPGCGIEASWNGSIVRAGNPHWLGLEELPTISELMPLGLTIFCVAVDGALVAIFGLQDKLRPDALATINELKRRSIIVSLISGDNDSAVRTIATTLGISTSNVRSQCTPAKKQAYVKEQLLRPNSIVLFCGDGTNDAAALA